MAFDPHLYWYLARASGIVAFALLTLSTGIGLAFTSRLSYGPFSRPWVFEVHKSATLLALAFTGLHLVTLFLDPWLDFKVTELLVPGASPYRPLPVAMGLLATYACVVIAASWLVKKQLGQKHWRALHYMTFGVFVLALGHGIYAGTDSGEPWMRLTYLTAGLAILLLTEFRILAAPKTRRRPAGFRAGASGGAVADGHA